MIQTSMYSNVFIFSAIRFVQKLEHVVYSKTQMCLNDTKRLHGEFTRRKIISMIQK